MNLKPVVLKNLLPGCVKPHRPLDFVQEHAYFSDLFGSSTEPLEDLEIEEH